MKKTQDQTPADSGQNVKMDRDTGHLRSVAEPDASACGEKPERPVMRYKTRGNASPQGRPRVYFCCHREDFGKTFSRITDQILDIQWNAAIWYRDPETEFPEDEGAFEDLALMQLFVIPVTSKFLFSDDPARTKEFVFAEEHHIPVLPIMQEQGLESEFNRICGDLQFLDPNAAMRDTTALPYIDKLKKFLRSVLVDDSTAERIRKAFDAYIFLSYRKKDRAAAQSVMKRIHQVSECRDMAIWYDEFLTPGENFNEEIEAAMKKSGLFTMVVTPSLLEEPNYVQTNEYPASVRLGMRRLPVMAEDTDEEELRRLYDDIGECFHIDDAEAVAARLRELTKDMIAGSDRNDPEHRFLMGLAYLSGVDVETDHERAVEFITGAAEDGGLPEAYEKLVEMYQTGDGVARDFRAALTWQIRYADALRQRAETVKTGDAYQDYFAALAYLQNYQTELELTEAACDTAYRMRAAADMPVQLGHEKGTWDLAVASMRIGDACFDTGQLAEAEEWYERAYALFDEIAEKERTTEAKRDFAMSCSRMGDVSAEFRQRRDTARYWYEQELSVMLEIEGDEPGKDIADIYSKIGDVYGRWGSYEEALVWYEKDLEISKRIYEQTGSADAAQDLAVTYGRIGMMYKGMGDTKEARRWYEKDLQLCLDVYQKTGTYGSMWNLSSTYEYMGDLSVTKGDMDDAARWYEYSENILCKITDMSDTPFSRFSHAGTCLKLGDISVLRKNEITAKDWYWKYRKILLSIESDEAAASAGKASVSVREALAISCYKLGILKSLSAPMRRSYLEELIRLGEELYKETGDAKHEDFILLGKSELRKR